MTMIYKPAEVMEMLDLKESTYKKYILELEKAGYVVPKDGRNRYFTQENIDALEQFIELLKYDGITIAQASKKIAEMYGSEVMTEEPKGYDVMSLVNEAVSTALEHQQKLFNEQMQQLLQQQEQKMIERENVRDQKALERDKLLMQSLKETLEVKKMLQDAKEEAAATTTQQKPWYQFWK